MKKSVVLALLIFIISFISAGKIQVQKWWESLSDEEKSLIVVNYVNRQYGD